MGMGERLISYEGRLSKEKQKGELRAHPHPHLFDKKKLAVMSWEKGQGFLSHSTKMVVFISVLKIRAMTEPNKLLIHGSWFRG